MPRPEPAPLAVAGSFLTRLPLPGGTGAEADLARAAPLFPLVGAALGGAVGGAALGFAQVLPALLAGLLAVGLELILTGALHADGLADSADGLGGRDPERSLEIMRDHTVGTYGAAALVLDLGVKAAALGVLAEAAAIGPVVAAMALSRATPLPLGRLLGYARPAAGTGRLLAGRVGTRSVSVGGGMALVIAAAAGGVEALPLCACAAAVTAGIWWLSKRRLGGITGDVMGAAIELTATCSLVLAAALAGSP